MKNILFFICFLSTFLGFTQNRFTKIVNDNQFKTTKNQLLDFISYDFSPVILGLNTNQTYGVIDTHFKRIHVKITNVQKDSVQPNLYHIKGKSMVGKALESFKGTLTLHTIKETYPIVLDNETVSLPTAYEGVLFGNYTFYEPKNNIHSGYFEGTYQGMFQITEENNVFYNDLALGKPNYFNNAFIGYWIDYETKIAKICKWADYRVPDVPLEFDHGVERFLPDEKFNQKGWKTYNDAYLNNNFKAKEAEDNWWWK